MAKLRASIGFSNDRDPERAARSAVGQALDGLGGGPPSLCLLFASVGHHQERLLKAAKSLLGSAPLIGCSGEGVIAGERADEGHFAVGALVMASDELRIHTGFHAHVPESRIMGRAVHDGLRRVGDEASVAFVFADGLLTRFDELAEGLTGDGSGPFVPVIGGLAGENWSMTQTHQYIGDQVLTGGVVWAILEGPFRVHYGISHGCRPIGSRLTVTRAEGTALYELDGRPVLDVLREYLTAEQVADWNRAVINLAFGFDPPPELQRIDPAYEHVIVHIIPTPEDARLGRVLLPRSIPMGTNLWIMRRDPERIRSSLTELISRLETSLGTERPVLALQVDCASRGQAVFPEQVRMGIQERLRGAFAKDLPWIGFYSYGELCPIGTRQCGHCYTAVLALLS